LEATCQMLSWLATGRQQSSRTLAGQVRVLGGEGVTACLSSLLCLLYILPACVHVWMSLFPGGDDGYFSRS
jgi:hypothetical protein